MNGFTAAGRALVCTAAGVALLAAPARGAEPINRMHDCGKLTSARFKAEMAIRGASCRHARPLLRAWLVKNTSVVGDGLPRSTRPRHWHCRRVIAWECEINGRNLSMVFSLELRRHGDLWATVTTAFATGHAGETYLDYRITVRNVGTDVVPGTFLGMLPPGAGFVSAAPTQGRCGTPDPGGRLRCFLGPVPTGFDNGARVSIRVSYDCSTLDPIGRASIAASSPAGDIDLSNNRANVEELDRSCPDPLDPFFGDPVPPDSPLPPDPMQPDPVTPPGNPAT